MSEKDDQINEILNSLANGQRKQMVEQIEEYGVYDFWPEYISVLNACFDQRQAYEYLSDTIISYSRIKNR